jgi:cellulose synthase/poly-beta-1,6-N-acetylglucosamine synthase-like glycosyltransferase
VSPVALALLAAAAVLVGYTYVGYPALLLVLRAVRRRRRPAPPLAEWPPISVTIPVHNEAATIAATLEGVLAADYPVERRQVLVVSDASSDGTDAVVAGFAARGVELVRMPVRRGKTAAENAVRGRLRGEIVVNMDASIGLPRHALKALVAAFADPGVGVASGRDVSGVRGGRGPANPGEGGYVSYEMWLRGLESAVGGIVGASGCFYAARGSLHREAVPDALSRDFAAALIARERGYRAVSVPEAVCFVPRTASLVQEYRRKVRTMVRGMGTLRYKRHLLNPFRYGLFAWMLWSHKVCRWAVPWALLVVLGVVAGWAAATAAARWVGALLGAGLAAGGVAWWWAARGRAPGIVQLVAFALAGNVAALHAGLKALRGELAPVWEPTRREPAGSAAAER